MPYVCSNPYDRSTATTKERVTSCTAAGAGPFEAR